MKSIVGLRGVIMGGLLFVSMARAIGQDAVEIDSDMVQPENISKNVEPIPEEDIVIADPTVPDVKKELLVPVPVFGTIRFKVGEKPEEGMFVQLPSRELGPFALRDIKLKLLHGVISCDAEASIFSFKGKVGLRELVYDPKKQGYRAVFGIGFDDKLKISFAPGVDLVFSDLNFVIEPSYIQEKGFRRWGAKVYKALADVTTARMYLVAQTSFLGTKLLLYGTRRKGRWVYALKIPEIKPFNRFAFLSDEVKKIRLYDIVAQLETFSAGQKVRFAGHGEMFGITSEAELFFGTKMSPTGDEEGVTFARFTLNKGDKISKLVPQLKGTLYDDFVTKDLSVIASSTEFDDIERKVRLVAGINFYGAVGLPSRTDSTLGHIGQLIGLSDFILFGGIALPNPLDSHIMVRVPAAFIKLDAQTARNFRFKSFDLEIKGTPSPMASLMVALELKPSDKDNWLTFMGRISIGVIEASLSATLQGTWRNPCGITPIKPIEIQGAAFEVGLTYTSPAAGMPMPNFGIKFDIQIGSVVMKAAAKLDMAQLQRSMIHGMVNHLGVRDMVDFASIFTGQPIPTDGIPDIRLEDFNLYIASTRTTIGEFTYEPGMCFKTKLIVPSGPGGKNNLFEAFVDISVNERGAKGKGYCTQFEIGPIKVTGTKPDKAQGAANEGPYVEFEFSPYRRRFYLSTIVMVADIIREKTQIDFDATHFAMIFETKLKDTIDSVVEIGGSLETLDASVLIDFKMFFIQNIKKALDEYTRQHGFEPITLQQQQQVVEAAKQISVQQGVDVYMKGLESRVDQRARDQAERAQQIIGGINKRMAVIASRKAAIDERIAKRQTETQARIQKRQRELEENIKQRMAERKKEAEERKRVQEQRQTELKKAAEDRRKALEERLATRRTIVEERVAARQRAIEERLKKRGKARRGEAPIEPQPQPEPGPSTPEMPVEPATQPVESFDRWFAQTGEVFTKEVALPFTRTMTESFMQVGQVLEKAVAVPAVQAVSVMLSLFRVDRFCFKGSINEVAQGILPKVDLEACVAGLKKSVSFQFDLRDAGRSAQTVSASVVDLFGRPGNQAC